MKIAQGMSDSWCVVTDERDCVSTVGEKVLADLRDDEFIDCNTEANARLIAAAPEMLEALEMFLKWDESGIPNVEDCIQRARTVIAKAKGESD